MSKCRLKAIKSSHGPTHFGNSMCFAVRYLRSSNKKTKPKSDDVISPNCSTFSEPVIIVYTFPCQSAAVLLSAFLLPLAASAVNTGLKHSFSDICVCPFTLGNRCASLNYVCFRVVCRSGMAVLWRRLRESLGMKQHSLTSMPHRVTISS